MLLFNIIISLLFCLNFSCALAEDVNIQQVPKNSKEYSNKEFEVDENSNQSQTNDYQNSILSDPNINDRARANALINSNNDNVVIINQEGDDNKSSVIQTGKNNIAKQTQKGKANDLEIEQVGDNHISEETQIGEHNHKIKVQNGKKEETIEEKNNGN